MLQHPTLDQLRHLKLHGMARAFAELGDNAQAGELVNFDNGTEAIGFGFEPTH